MGIFRVREGEMGWSETAMQRNDMGLPATLDGEETPAAILSCETLRWSELTYRDRTFVFKRDLVIRVLEEEGGWSFAEDKFSLLGFGHTRSEAEYSFCLDFAIQWDDLACEEDEKKLSKDAIELKHALLGLVKAQR
jgi:hypothetical protein